MANKYRSVLASGGGVQPTGNAQPADVLAGKTFSNADGINKTGTMVNNGAVSETLDAGESYTIPAGYHNGSGVVTANDPQGTPPTGEITRTTSSSNNNPVFIPTYGKSFKVKSTQSMHLFGFKFSELLNNTMIIPSSDFNSTYPSGTAGVTVIGTTSTTYTEVDGSLYDMVSLHIRSSSSSSSQITVTWD